MLLPEKSFASDADLLYRLSLLKFHSRTVTPSVPFHCVQKNGFLSLALSCIKRLEIKKYPGLSPIHTFLGQSS